MSGLQVSMLHAVLLYIHVLILLFIYMALADEIVCQSTWSSSTNVAIVVGVIIALAAMVVTNVIIFLLCWLRYVRW